MIIVIHVKSSLTWTMSTILLGLVSFDFRVFKFFDDVWFSWTILESVFRLQNRNLLCNYSISSVYISYIGVCSLVSPSLFRVVQCRNFRRSTLVVGHTSYFSMLSFQSLLILKFQTNNVLMLSPVKGRYWTRQMVPPYLLRWFPDEDVFKFTKYT